MKHRVTAYEVRPTDDWAIERASARREWMDHAPKGAANRCLPLVIANQAGWVITCPVSFKATWDGSDSNMSGLKLEFQEKAELYGRQILSLFGMGIISFSLPWLFRTSEGVGMIVRGPTNSMKDHCAPLDGFVETDWAPYTFTMNWKITKRKTPVYFRKGEPVCLLQPYPIGMLEETEARAAPISSDPELHRTALAWNERRNEEIQSNTGREKSVFSLDYVKGKTPGGGAAPEHRTKLRLAAFERDEASDDGAGA